MWKKFGRNAAILIVFCVALLLLVQLGSWLFSNRNDDLSQGSISEARRLAEANLYREYPEPAIRYFNVVLEDDPYNGFATFGCAEAHRIKYFQACHQTDPDPAELKQIADEALQQFELALDFPRFRNKALHSMSMINAHQGNSELALQQLKQAFDNGYVSEDGHNFLQNSRASFYYQSMLQDRRLYRLQAQELRNFAGRGVQAPTIGGGKSKNKKRKSK